MRSSLSDCWVALLQRQGVLLTARLLMQSCRMTRCFMKAGGLQCGREPAVACSEHGMGTAHTADLVCTFVHTKPPSVGL